MNEMYKEILVKRKTPFVLKLVKPAAIVLIALLVVLGLAVPLIWIAAAAAAAAAYFLLPRINVEYEYLYVNGDIDIDAIYSKQKRKRVASYTMEELEILAPENSHALDSYRQKKLTVRDFTSGDEQNKVFVLIENLEKGQEYVRLELTEAILKDMRRMAPRKIVLM